MPFAIPIKDGQVMCPCCRDHLWHCKRCWDQYHNGRLHNDYEPPKYYGQPMNEEVDKKLKEEFGVEFTPSIKADKNKPYKEGEYH